MKYRIENKFTGSYLYIKDNEADVQEVKYDITGMTSIVHYYTDRCIPYEVLHSIVDELVKFGKQIEFDDKDINGIVLNPDYIFIRKSDMWIDDYKTDGLPQQMKATNIQYIYYPYCERMDVAVQMLCLAEYIIEHVEYKDKRAVNLAYGFYLQVINKNYVFDSLLQHKNGD